LPPELPMPGLVREQGGEPGRDLGREQWTLLGVALELQRAPHLVREAARWRAAGEWRASAPAATGQGAAGGASQRPAAPKREDVSPLATAGSAGIPRPPDWPPAAPPAVPGK